MKAHRALTIFVLLVSQVILSQELPTLTAEQILDRNLDAIGGKKAWAQVKTVLVESNFTGAPSVLWLSAISGVKTSPRGKKGTLQVIYELPDKYRSLMSVDGVGYYFYACNGEARWWNRSDGTFEVDRTGKSKCKAPAYPQQWSDRYNKLEVKGTKNIDGHLAYVIRLTPKEGTPSTEYFDTESFLLVRSENSLAIPAYLNVMMVEDFADYRDVSGVKVPFLEKRSVRTSTGMDESTITVVRCVINSELSDGTFSLPEPKKISKTWR